MSQCMATLRSANGGVTFYCGLEEGHKGDHFNEGPLSWWFDDGLAPSGEPTEVCRCEPEHRYAAYDCPRHGDQSLREPTEPAPGVEPVGLVGALEQSERDLCYQIRTVVNLCEMGYPTEAAKRGRDALRGVDRSRQMRSHWSVAGVAHPPTDTGETEALEKAIDLLQAEADRLTVERTEVGYEDPRKLEWAEYKARAYMTAKDFLGRALTTQGGSDR